MAEYLGTIAGIGEKLSTLTGLYNIIYPEFDATFRNFIMGEEFAIIDGLEIDGDELTSGVCVAKGFLGYSPSRIKLNKQEKTVEVSQTTFYTSPNGTEHIFTFDIAQYYPQYSGKTTGNVSIKEYKFTSQQGDGQTPIDDDRLTVEFAEVVNGNIQFSVANTTGEEVAWNLRITFYLGVYQQNVYAKFVKNTGRVQVGDHRALDEFYILDETPEKITRDDILHKTGTYILPLYVDGAEQCPRRSYPKNARYSDEAYELRKNGTIAAAVTVDGEIDPSDSTAKVATTKFVQDVIDKEINSATARTYLTYGLSQQFNAVELRFKRKSKLVICEHEILENAPLSGLNNTISIPNGYEPVKDSVLVIKVGISGRQFPDIFLFKLPANSNTATFYADITSINESFANPINGWETE